MKYFFLTLLILIIGNQQCEAQFESPEYRPTVTRINSTQLSWYELPQYYNGVSKYSGLLGTYTAKHLPAAVHCELGTWATYSNNRDGNLSIYAVQLETQQSHLVHVVKDQIDPHQNAAIQCGGGKLWLAVSARGYKRLGYLYSSTDGVNWTLESSGFRSYPQLHWLNNSLLFLYTEYKMDSTQENGVSRKIYSSCNNKPIINDDIQHYMLSFVDNGRVHIVFNDLIGGADFRTNLNYTYSDNGGCTWSTPVRWHSGDFVYLKDFRMVSQKPAALVVISNSADPTVGERQVFTISANKQYWHRGATNHNYTTGAMTNGGDLAFPDGGASVYAGGELYGAPHANYARRIFGTSNQFIASEGISSEYKSDSWLIWIKE